MARIVPFDLCARRDISRARIFLAVFKKFNLEIDSDGFPTRCRIQYLASIFLVRHLSLFVASSIFSKNPQPGSHAFVPVLSVR